MSFALLTACLVLFQSAAASSSSERPPIPFGGTDFKQYYATSKLILSGHNPYDHHRAWQLQEPLGAKEVQVPYGPPTSLLPFLPLGWLDFPSAVQVFFGINVTMLVLCCFFWAKLLFPGDELLPLLAVTLLLAWTPCLSYFWLGQVSAFPLLGFTLWVVLMRQGWPVAAGVVLALGIIKPHLAAGPVLYALVIGWRQRQWSMLTALLVTVAAMVALTVLIRPTIWSEYRAALPQLNPTQWYNATLDGWARRALEQTFPTTSAEWFRAVSLVLAAAMAGWIAVLGWKQPLRPDLALLSLVLWMAGTPYAFGYDYILLLPGAILALGVAVRRSHPHWLLVIAGWMTLDVYYLVTKALGREHGWFEYHFFILPWGALALTLMLLSRGAEVPPGLSRPSRSEEASASEPKAEM